MKVESAVSPVHRRARSGSLRPEHQSDPDRGNSGEHHPRQNLRICRPPADNPSTGMWPPLPGRRVIASPTISATIARTGSGHHFGGPWIASVALARLSRSNVASYSLTPEAVAHDRSRSRTEASVLPTDGKGDPRLSMNGCCQVRGGAPVPAAPETVPGCWTSRPPDCVWSTLFQLD